MYRFILILVFLVSSYGQNVVQNWPVFTGEVIGQLPDTSATLPYMGQSHHMLELTLTGSSCGTSQFIYELLLQFQDNNTVWHNFMVMEGLVNYPIGPTTNAFSARQYASGLYVAVRAKFVSMGTGCTANVTYAGSLYPFAKEEAAYGFLTGTLARTTGTTAVTGALNSLTSGLGTNDLTNFSGMKVNIYGVTLANMSAGAETLTVTFPDNTGAGCGAVANTWFTFVLPPGNTTTQSFTLPNSTVPYWTNPLPYNATGPTYNPSICVNAGANASTHNFFASAVFKIEH